jgi:hypothetical protein
MLDLGLTKPSECPLLLNVTYAAAPSELDLLGAFSSAISCLSLALWMHDIEI